MTRTETPTPEAYERLRAEAIVATVATLHRRIEERFPGSGLAGVAGTLLRIARLAEQRAEAIAKPILGLRVAIVVFVTTLVALLLTAFVSLEAADLPRATFMSAVAFAESAINDLVFFGIAVVFLVSLERRVKRHRAFAALHELRVIAHVIDMHQLTKDPGRLGAGARTASSPALGLSAFELSRYLDYCSEMLSLTGKLAALYVQEFTDSPTIAAVQEIESLTTGLSRKIWQKMILIPQGSTPASASRPSPSPGPEEAGSG